MLLSFFETFRKYTILGKFTPPRMKAENFTQKINSYFNSISQPILIVLDSFDVILKENRQDILNFLKHIKNSENVKIILRMINVMPNLHPR
jgi:archaellum biogenesis ATPase FlaH